MHSPPPQAVAAVMKDGEPAKTVLWGMAPEVMVDQKHPNGPTTDIWAVGCVTKYIFVNYSFYKY